MKLGPKYKLARRLNAPIFEKTQTQKYALSQSRREKTSKSFMRPKSEFGAQLLEKQKARFTYGLSERQFSNYVKTATEKKDTHAVSRVYEALELRADNIAYRAGFAPTRSAARQMTSHGHLMVNGKRITIPSYRLSQGDTLSIRSISKEKPLYRELAERLKATKIQPWLKVDGNTGTATIEGNPKYDQAESMFDLNAVLEFYSR